MISFTSQAQAFDVITVPDFSGSGRAVFEARTLVFLASWMEYAGEARHYPLHLACIGEPPPSVRLLAGQCGARITVHDPLQLRQGHHVGNKLRGLEISNETENYLLLDVDIAILSDISSASALAGSLATSPDDAPNVTIRDWRVIYSTLELPLPTPIKPLVHELGLPRFPRRMMGFESEDNQTRLMLPYYNGGVVFAPWAADLRTHWEKSILKIASLFDESKGTRRWIHQSDQAGLAIAIAMLRRDGWDWQRLPDKFNARWQHLYAGSPEMSSIAVMHCCWSFLNSIGNAEVGLGTLKTALRHFFQKKIPHRFQKVGVGELLRLRPDRAYHGIRGGRMRTAQVHEKILFACEKHLAGVLGD
ncbi:hypothetical protein [Synechococcus sp. GFB01]|uniref:hypothetical protein n=1 Tax=Synechococcus sp. GFB01 TaxID=1662190 RepID=UPI000B0F4495|nr:hypothetical protein [Synechococcus sp. GFB01]